MKTFDVHDILTTLTAKDAKVIISKPCFVGGDLDELKDDVENDNTDALDAIEYGCSYPFKCSSGRYPYLLPVDKVKEVEEKKWRAFKDLDEFAEALGLVHILGSEITYRTKTEDTKGSAIITRESESESGSVSYISLGSHSLSLENLFKYYEWLDKDGIWQPFGVQE